MIAIEHQQFMLMKKNNRKCCVQLLHTSKQVIQKKNTKNTNIYYTYYN